ncbi:MAG: carbohydrate ABC transporter permease [Clostridia bacterium]|nr:carbohydrate ABC transporter permease [Clostridia bacterium]
MNAQNIDNKPKVQKETKNKIRVEFERTPLKERLKAKFLSTFFLQKVVFYIFRLVLLVGISYIVLFPFFSKITGSIMAPEDFADATVRLIPKNVSFDIYKAIWTDNAYLEAFTNTLLLSVSTALLQTFICCFVAYGLAKFKFKGNGLIFLAVIFSLTIPHQTLQFSMSEKFVNFDILGIMQFLNGGGINILGIFKYTNESLAAIDIIPDSWEMFIDGYAMNLTNTFWPLIVLSICGLAFKNGLYIFMLRQFFRGVPDELEESAYIDGSGIMRTFFTIILPLSVPMMITVFLFSFSWQWTDEFYINLFFPGSDTVLMDDIYRNVPTTLSKLMDTVDTDISLYKTAIRNTGGLMIIAPLIVMYLFCQRYLIQGIERSGLTAD